MKRTLAALVTALSLSAGSALAADPGVKAVDEAFTKAMLANDAAAVAACYADDAVLVMPGSPALKGKKAIAEALAGFLGSTTVKEFSVSDVRYESSGHLSAAWGRFRMTTAPKSGGAPTTETGTFSEVAVKRNGKWGYLSDHAAADPPPPAPAK